MSEREDEREEILSFNREISQVQSLMGPDVGQGKLKALARPQSLLFRLLGVLRALCVWFFRKIFKRRERGGHRGRSHEGIRQCKPLWDISRLISPE